ncbi:MAG: thioesterase family protein [Propionicimonas sp.]|uniref:acyl-CoA thioesterase n=1 Tax=Propionicimonas sp. TaxID=1955623 RepID=UPI003D104207
MSGFVSRVPLRWVDLDAQGHVNNAVVADYLQEARVDWLLSGSNAHLLGSSTMVVSHQVEYLGPVAFGVDPVEVELRVGTVGAARFTLGYSVVQDGRELARARSVLCLYDYVAGRPRRMTSAERSWFVDQSGPLEPFGGLGDQRVGERAHAYDFVVRWSDLDPYGHVNNVRVFDFVAEARIRMNPDGDDTTRMHTAAADGLLWMVARQDVDYVGQIAHRSEPYRVRSAIGRVGRTSVTIVAQVEDPLDGSVLTRTRTVLVCGDATGRPVPLPESMRAAAARWPAL